MELAMNASSVLASGEISGFYNNSVSRFYNRLMNDYGDPRTKDWFLMDGLGPGAVIMFSYLYFVLSWGPRHMERRKPYKLNNVLVAYNFFQVILSVWLFYEGLDAAWLRKYSWKCEPVDFSTTPEALRIARGVYIYFLAKLTELLDTVFFVLRKKDNQISFLHMYHHTVMPMIAWGATKYYPGGHGTFIGVINSFVHIIMYTYYLLAALLPQYQKYLWWKKYITTLQMGQFCVAFIHSFQLLFYDCEYPRWSLFLILPNVMFFYFLFSDFYNSAYTSDGKKAAKKNKLQENGKVHKAMNGKTHEMNGIAHEETNGKLHEETNGKLHEEMNGKLHEQLNGKLHEELNGKLYEQMNGKLHEEMNGKSYEKMNGKISNHVNRIVHKDATTVRESELDKDKNV